jgi:hypothetical protein
VTRPVATAARRFLTPAQLHASHAQATQALARQRTALRRIEAMPPSNTRSRLMHQNRRNRERLAEEVRVLEDLLRGAS